MRKFILPAPEAFGQNRTVGFALFDSPSAIADARMQGWGGSDSWYGGHSLEEAKQFARRGDLSSVPSSNGLMAKFESFALPSSRSTWTPDVAGAFPDIGAFLSGSPLTMRRRSRVESESAPLAVILDLTTSAAIAASQVASRGAAILALVRLLSARRPLELWLLSGLDAAGGNACFVGCKVNTTPLDLATAAHCITHVGFARHLFYSIAREEFGYAGHWPFYRGQLSRSEMETLLAPAFTHVSETLCLPALHVSDPSLTDPEGWLKRELELHDPLKLESCDA